MKCALVVLVVLALSSAPAAQEVERRSLERLPGVQVVVENIKEEAEREGLTTAFLTTAVELRVRQAGITVFRSTDEAYTKGQPSLAMLYLNVNTIAETTVAGALTGRFVYAVSLELEQAVRSLVTTQDLRGTTWHLGSVGTVGANNVRHHVHEKVTAFVDAFINDYLAANPKGRDR